MSTACFFFLNDTATTEIYTLSLHDALPIFRALRQPDPRRVPADLGAARRVLGAVQHVHLAEDATGGDRKSTRLNSSHSQISYAVFCLKKKKNKHSRTILPQLEQLLLCDPAA